MRISYNTLQHMRYAVMIHDRTIISGG